MWLVTPSCDQISKLGSHIQALGYQECYSSILSYGCSVLSYFFSFIIIYSLNIPKLYLYH